MSTKITATVTIDFASGKRDVLMEAKQTCELKNCIENTLIVLIDGKGDSLLGLYKGTSEGNVIIKALKSENTIAVGINSINYYFEKINDETAF